MKVRLLKILRKQAQNFLNYATMERGIPIWQANVDMYSSEGIIKSSWPMATILDIF